MQLPGANGINEDLAIGNQAPIGGNYQALRSDFQHLMVELSRDRQELIKEYDVNGISKQQMKAKIDALAWHGRVLNLLPISSVQEALLLYKKTLLPTDNATVRNGYIKFRDHRSNGIVTLVNILKNEAM